ncbi:MAG TPA: extensin family protein [Polyangiaceae bacterium]
MKAFAADHSDYSSILTMCLCVSSFAFGCTTLETGSSRQPNAVSSASAPLSKLRNAESSVSREQTPARNTAAGHTLRDVSADTADAGAERSGVDVTNAEQPHGQAVEATFQLPMEPARSTGRALAAKYANLSPPACRAEVRRKKSQAVAASGAASGIAAPMRLVGTLRGVRFVAPGPKSVHGMLDCRLVLLLDELAPILSDHGIATVYVDGFYRPKAHLPGKKAPSQHAFGLAIDIHSFGTADGRLLNIERDFAGRIGDPVCGDGAAIDSERRESVELRNVVCAIARARAFNYLLTPNHDVAHRNHIHGDIKRNGREQVVK